MRQTALVLTSPVEGANPHGYSDFVRHGFSLMMIPFSVRGRKCALDRARVRRRYAAAAPETLSLRELVLWRGDFGMQ